MEQVVELERQLSSLRHRYHILLTMPRIPQWAARLAKIDMAILETKAKIAEADMSWRRFGF